MPATKPPSALQPRPVNVFRDPFGHVVLRDDLEPHCIAPSPIRDALLVPVILPHELSPEAFPGVTIRHIVRPEVDVHIALVPCLCGQCCAVTTLLCFLKPYQWVVSPLSNIVGALTLNSFSVDGFGVSGCHGSVR